MKIAWFDASAGASGDMILGALIDAGLDAAALEAELQQLDVPGWRLAVSRVKPRGIAASEVEVVIDADAPRPHRHLRHIIEILRGGALPPGDVERATAIFTRLAEAEARVHDTSVEQIHFHEVGALDAIVDVVGAVVGLRLLGVEQVACTPLPISHGWVDCEHGRLPVPAPATLELLRGVPTVPLDLEGETLTPTGAAILTTLSTAWQPPAMTPAAIGYGAGSRDFGVPNVLRVTLGEAAATPARVVVIEANLDDMSPEWYDRAVQRIFAAGALDVTLSPLQMKKGRPGVLLRAVADPAARAPVSEAILRETTSLGVRWFAGERECLARTWLEVATRYGPVSVKIGRRAGEVLNIAPEYESVARAAEAHQASLPSVEAAAREAAMRVLEQDPAAGGPEDCG